jgi:hypothetical protein
MADHREMTMIDWHRAQELRSVWVERDLSMKKLTTLFSVTVLATTLALAGCKGKRGEEQKDNTQPAPAAKSTDTPTPAPTPTTPPAADPTKAADPAAAPAAPAAAEALPAECSEYKAAVDKLGACDKLDAKVKTQLKADYDKAATGWTSLTADTKAAAGTQCKTSLDAVTKAAKTPCGW